MDRDTALIFAILLLLMQDTGDKALMLALCIYCLDIFCTLTYIIVMKLNRKDIKLWNILTSPRAFAQEKSLLK